MVLLVLHELLLAALSTRRAVLVVGTTAAVAHPGGRALAVGYAPGFEPKRIEGIGGGFDMLSEQPIADVDILYPPSLNGTWVCERRVASVEGDVGQAQGAWRLLGGTGDLQSGEKYYVRFVDLRRASDAMTVS